MKNLILVMAMAVAFSAMQSAAKAEVALEGRNVPFSISADEQVSGTRIVSRELLDSSLSIDFVLTKPELSQAYALHLPAGTNVQKIAFNGRPLDIDPLPRADGPLYMVDSANLKEGTNSVAVYTEGQTVDSWSGTKLFSLVDSFEESHFNQAFDDRKETDLVSLKEIPMTSGQNQYDVLSYDCTWKPDMSAPRLLSGTNVIIRGKALVNNFQTVALDFDFNPGGNSSGPEEMTVTAVDSGPSTANLTWSGSGTVLNVTLPSPLSINQEFTVRVHYHGSPNDSFPKQIFGSKPFNRSTHGSPSRAVVYTASQPYGARRWWPCKDHPSDKADTTVQRIIVPTNLGYSLTAVSNGELQSITNNGDNTETHTWASSYPISTYLVSMAITNYTLVQTTYTSRDGTKTMPLGHYIYPENMGIEGNGHLGTLQVMNFFADKFGEYPFLDEKYMTATWNITFAIEHQTCTSMPGSSTQGVGNGLTRRNIHELAHHWFGNKVTCHNWDHVWLNEGFATYCEALYTEHSNVFGSYSNYVNSWGVSTTVPVVNSNGDSFVGSVVYRKGAWVLHMLRAVLGDTAFFQALRDYAATGYTTALSQTGGPVSFQAVCENAAGLSSGALTPFFNQWLTGYDGGTYSNRPRYGAAGTLTIGGTNSVSLNLRQTQAGLPYTMPVKIRFKDAANNTFTHVVENSTANQVFNIDVGSNLPVEFEIDPDNWILKYSALTLNTVGLPNGYTGFPYSHSLRATGVSGTATWSKLAGAPAWVTVSSSGVISGTPPGDGIYSIPVRVTDSTGFRETTLNLNVSTATVPQVVINEVFYDNYGSSSDAGEYIELYNASASPADISGWKVVLVNGQDGNSYSPGPILIPSGTTLASGAYYVIGNATTINATHPGAVNLNVNLNNLVQDGVRDATASVDAVVLKTGFDMRVDSVSYSASRVFGSGSETSNARAEGGTGMVVSFPLGTANNASLGRLPDGTDSGSNLHDFANIPPSPGSANLPGITLPFTDSFDSGASSAWRRSFKPVRTVSAGAAGVPAVAAPGPDAGGSFLEVYDSTGGGDSAYLPGSWNQVNFTGYLWIPQDVSGNGWSTGVGVASRNESAWFSHVAGYEIPNGFYLEYQNGPLSGTALSNGALPSVAGTIRLLAVDGAPSLNVGPASAVVTTLGSSMAVQKQGWNKFRLIFDVPNNRLYASLNDSIVLYNGSIPAGNHNSSGGVVIGFREQHSGTPSSANVEGTWVDQVTVDTNTAINASVEDFFLY